MNSIRLVFAFLCLFVAVVLGSVATVVTLALITIVVAAIAVLFVVPGFFVFVGAYILGDLKWV
jgi:hypothetical protein